MRDLPTGTVTFLFTDIAGSTRLLQDLGPERYGPLQDAHMRLVREAIAAGGGTEIRTEGDAFFVVFPTAAGAIRAAVAAQRALSEHPWPDEGPIQVRMGMHTGEGRLGGDDYLGLDVNLAARIAAAGHGGQVLISDATRSLVGHDLPEGVALRDLGDHRLKDLHHAERLYDLVIDGLPAEFPPLSTLEIPTRLPADTSSFIGRQEEVDEVARLLHSVRLVTLTGPAGSGKTRLALRAASVVKDRFPGGVFFVELAAVTDPELVPGVIASVVGTGEFGPRPVMEMIALELRQRTVLLVLDNFEQVLGAAPTVRTLLASAPEVRILVTSRSPLRIQGEQDFPVRPLDLPDPALPPSELGGYGAVALFVERATAVDPGFVLDEENAGAVAEICRRLDGLPLAIELAASRLRLLTPGAILERLDRALPLLTGGSRDLPARQRTLRGAIGWSYELLSPEIASLFRRICVFSGGFTIEAAHSVCDPDGEFALDPLEGLEALLDSSLVRRRPDPTADLRLETLQTVREYGLERLEEEGEAPAAAERHARYFLRSAAEAEAGLRGPDLLHDLRVLDAEHDNLRAALSWAIERDEGELALRLVRSLWRFWHFHGDLTAGRRWAQRALDLPSATDRTPFRARALIGAGGLAYWQKDYAAAEAAYEEALAISQELDDPGGIAEATFNLAYMPLIAGRVDEAAEMFRRSIEAFESLEDPFGVAESLFGLSVASRMGGDLTHARTTAEECFRLHYERGDLYGMTAARYILGRAAAESRDPDTARQRLLETLDSAEQMGDRTAMALSLDNLAACERIEGNLLRAVRLAGASRGIKDAVGGEGPPELVDLPDVQTEARRILSPEEVDAAWEEGRAMSLDEAVSYAREKA